MGFLDRLFGRSSGTSQQQPTHVPRTPRPVPQATDEQALARYRYLLRTAPPEQIEATHAEAFARLTPEQRQMLLTQLSQDLPADGAPRSDDPKDLARAATRAELRQPGYLPNRLGGMTGPGFGSTFASSMLGTVTGVVVGSMIYDAIFDGYDSSPEAMASGDTGEGVGSDAGYGDEGAFSDGGDAGDAGDVDVSDYADTGTDLTSDMGSYDAGSSGGGDFFGGDFGGGDFGGGFDSF